MSSSTTVSRSGATLRRPILSTDQKPTQDLPSSDQIQPSPVIPETIVQQPKKPTQDLPTNSTTKLRKRTVVKKGTVPRAPWKTAVRVIVKNLGVLVVLLGLIQLVRRLVFNRADGFVFDSVGFESDYERRVAEVEAFVKTTTKMMQVQVEVVDRKVESEIAGLRAELSKKIDVVEKKLGGFGNRIEGVEKTVAGTEWLTKNEFDKFVEEFKGKKGSDDVGGLKLDEIRAFAREVVEREIGKHAADGLGKVDYAVASGGATVVRHSEAFSGTSRVMGWFSGNVRSDAVKVLQPSFGQPGECFPLKGDAGFVEIKLRTAIVPEAITLEHVSKSVAFDSSSAPKDCTVWGWLHNEEGIQKEHLLTEFTYDLEKSVAQTFNVLDTNGIIDTVRLQFDSNHGSPTHTCIYRVRVHGHQPNVS